jgi:excisionase family DNA binding protein
VKIDVDRAAGILGVSAVQVRRLIDAGELSAERFGRSWQVDLDSVHRYDDLRPKVGRPANAQRSWEMLAADHPGSLQEARSLAVKARRRADRHLGRVSPGELPYLLQADGVVVSGTAAAMRHGAPVQDRPPHAIYIKRSLLDDVSREHGMRFVAADDANLVVRVVEDEVWPFHPGDRYASAVVALIDLVDDRDDRSAREVLHAL